MSSLPPPMQGQLEAPNPLELFWDRYRKLFWAGLIALAAAIGLYYGWQYLQRSARASAAAKFASVSGLAGEFSRPARGFGDQFAGLDEAIKTPDIAKLQAEIASSKNPAFKPWLLWVLANRHERNRDFDQALEVLNQLERDHPNHILNLKSDFPPQLRLQVVRDEKDEKPKRNKEPELDPPAKGSPVMLLREAIQSQQRFRKDRPDFFEPSNLAGPKLVMTLAGVSEKITVQLFEAAAPEHVAHIKKLVEQKHFDKLRFYRVARNPLSDPDGNEPQTLHFGLKAANSPDTSGWEPALKSPSPTTLPFPENEHQSRLSFFPGTLAAEIQGDGKTSGERLFFAINDCAAAFDQRRVVLGRVVEGLSVLREIVTRGLQDQAQDDLGIGRLGEDLVIESVTLANN